jgi:two-component system invasion response regulator UvrY
MVAARKMYLEANIAQQMAIQQLNGEKNPVDVLSDREFEVFMSLAKGQTTNEIADILSLSPRTVGTHLYNIKQKLNANNSAEIALIAMRSGLIDP